LERAKVERAKGIEPS